MSVFATALTKNISRYLSLLLDSGTPVPSGSDILDEAGGAIVGGDLDIRDTGSHYFVIPMANSGWRKLLAMIKQKSTALDQAVTVYVYGGFSSATSAVRLAQFTLVSVANAATCIGEGAGNVGAQLGDGGDAVSSVWYDIPGINAGWPYIFIRLQAGTGPSTGGIYLHVVRSS